MDKSLHNYHYGTFIIVNTYTWLSCVLRIRGFHTESLFPHHGSAALKVAAEIPIWEMGKRTLKSEAISCPTAPTAVFPCPICDRFPKIVNALRDACKPPLWHLIISTNKYMGHRMCLPATRSLPEMLTVAPRRKIFLPGRSRPLSCADEDASTGYLTQISTAYII